MRCHRKWQVTDAGNAGPSTVTASVKRGADEMFSKHFSSVAAYSLGGVQLVTPFALNLQNCVVLACDSGRKVKFCFVTCSLEFYNLCRSDWTCFFLDYFTIWEPCWVSCVVSVCLLVPTSTHFSIVSTEQTGFSSVWILNFRWKNSLSPLHTFFT